MLSKKKTGNDDIITLNLDEHIQLNFQPGEKNEDKPLKSFCMLMTNYYLRRFKGSVRWKKNSNSVMCPNGGRSSGFGKERDRRIGWRKERSGREEGGMIKRATAIMMSVWPAWLSPSSLLSSMSALPDGHGVTSRRWMLCTHARLSAHSFLTRPANAVRQASAQLILCGVQLVYQVAHA